VAIEAHNMPRKLFSCMSVHRKIVHLTDTVWTQKILKNHSEFIENPGYLVEVRRTIESPDYVVTGWAGEYLALRMCHSAPKAPKYLCVVYRELDDNDGFVITTFFISKPQKLLRRGIVWRKQS
jgi:hypothetical protein